MVRRYKERLVTQIDQMLKLEHEAAGRHSRTNSLQSASGLSSDGSQETSACAIRGWYSEGFTNR